MVEAEELLERIKESVRFILVGTSHPGNIGASARAMKNMGLKKMELVSPKDFPVSYTHLTLPTKRIV